MGRGCDMPPSVAFLYSVGDRDGADDMNFLKAVTAPLPALAEEQKLHVFRREDFFQTVDGLRDKNHFARLRSCSSAPWKRWC